MLGGALAQSLQKGCDSQRAERAHRWTKGPRLLAALLISTIMVQPGGATVVTTTGGGTAGGNINPGLYQTPSPPNLTTYLGTGTCADQYTQYINSLNDTANILNTAGLGAQTVAWGADATGLGVEIAGAFSMAAELATEDVVANPSPAEGAGMLAGGLLAHAVGVAANLAATGTQIAAQKYTVDQQTLTDNITNDGLPSCGAEFAGTVNADSNLNVAQGIAADNGALNLGNPYGQTYQTGIALGGGAVSGLGSSGPSDGTHLANTGDVTAIAIGNGANAADAGSTALGLGANASAPNSTAIGPSATASGSSAVASGYAATASGNNASAYGANSLASGLNSAAVGASAQATGVGSSAFGDNAKAIADRTTAFGVDALANQLSATAGGDSAQAVAMNSSAFGVNTLAGGVNSTAAGDGAQAIGANTAAYGVMALAIPDLTTAVGPGATVAAAAGVGSFAGGTSTVLSGTGAVAIGNLNLASGNGAVAIGDPNLATGAGAVAIGNGNVANGQGAVASGNANSATGQGAVAIGDGNTSNGPASVALGQRSNAIGAGATAIGQSARALANNAVAIGSNAAALADNSTALGTGATVHDGAFNSMAIGANSAAYVPNNIVIGNADGTITLPGMDSDLSRWRQTGLLGVVTSDALGNLASDNGALYKQTAGIKAGAAVAMALSDPVLNEHQSFGLKMNAGGFDGASALGVSAAGVLARKMFSPYDSLTVSAAGGYGQAAVSGYSKNTFGVRASVQLAW